MKKRILSLSGGKDSTAMLLKLIHLHTESTAPPIDEIVFFDTGMEFQAIYDNDSQLSANS